MMTGKALVVAALLAIPPAGQAAKGKIEIEQDHPTALYRTGEEARFTVAVRDEAGALLKTGTAQWTLDNYGTTSIGKGTADLAAGNPFVVRGTMTEDGFLRLKVNAASNAAVWSVGYDVEKIRQAEPCPADFDAYWTAEKARLEREVPLDARCARDGKLSTAAYDTFRISFATFNGKRVYGFLSVPTDKSRAPFRLRVNVPGAGPGSVSAATNPGEISLVMNVHSFDAAATPAEQQKLMDAQNRALAAKYGMPGGSYCGWLGIGESREEYYYHDVMLGINRAVDWACARKDVDLSQVVYSGSSQGGGFGLYLNYLNRHFTKTVVAVSAMTGHYAHLQGRQNGWPDLIARQGAVEKRAVARRAAAYYDGIHFAARIRTPIRFIVGFADSQCPPHDVYAAYNVCPSKDKAIINAIGSPHNWYGWYDAHRGKPECPDINAWLNTDVQRDVIGGTAASAQSASRPMPAEGSRDAKRPYEMVWANRRAETPAPVDRLESAEGWRAEATNGEARVATADDRLVFGDGVMRFDYRGTGKSPVAKALRNQPLALPPFDTFSVWIYGNNFYGRPKDTPITQVFAEFADAEGRPFSWKVTTIVHREWCKFIVKVPEGLRAQTKAGGWKHLGFRVTGGTNPDFRRLDFTSFCAYVETFGPLAYKPRAKRGVQIFKDQDQGVNTGFGHLPFPTTERTVIPPCEQEDAALEFRFPAKDGIWDDLAFRVKGGEWVALSQGGGVWPRTAADRAKATFRRVGNAVVADVVVKGGDVEEMRFGTLGVPTNAVNVTIPFYRWGSNYGWERPRVVVAETKDGPRFIGCVMDWTQSNASEPYMPRLKEPGIASFGGALYKTKTDGRRNDVYERFVWTVSPTFEGTLPTIPNPVSPWRHVTGRTCWIANFSQPDRATNIAHWTAMTRKGIRRMTVTDHEVGWRDGMESYTFRTNSAPKKGGDPNWYAYARKMIDEFGFYYGPYNNFTDLTPVNEHWDPDHVSRLPDGSLKTTWSRCWSPKPLYGLEMCEKLTPVIAEKFGFNTAYCDVHTAVTPWSRTDYDWRVPGAGTMTQTFYAYGEIMLIQKHCWKGPVSSEGGNQWFYAGLVDQNYGQDCPYRLDKNPWIVDFELLRAHPLGSDHGMGYSGMLWGDRNVPKDVWEILRTWYPATLAFGHAAFLLPEHPSYAYYMTLAIASRYSQENVRSIRYADAAGKLYTTSEAVVSGVYKDSRIIVDYDGGTHVEVNLHGKGSVFARGGDTVVFSGAKNGAVGDFCRGGDEAGYVYINGRGKRFTTPCGSAACELIRLAEKGGTEEVIPADNPKAAGERLNEVGLPYAAKRIVALGADKAEERGEISFRTDANGWTWFTPRAGDYSYRVTLPAGYAEPSPDACVRWCTE